MPSQKTTHSSDFELTHSGNFIIKDYSRKKPFSNFLPGIAGLFGTPMWAFYVNRGQGIASFGTRNKDNAILEFFPANKAYQMVSTVGFRTFLKIKPQGAPDAKLAFYEPFSDLNAAVSKSQRTMEISSHEMALNERVAGGLESAVTYFTIPGEPIAALARVVTLTNHSGTALDVEFMDGLPQVNPYGMNEFFTKQMSRTIEAWMVVENTAKNAPFYKLKVDATDRPEVTYIEGGNFVAGFMEEGRSVLSLDALVDPSVIFGHSLDFLTPTHFYKSEPYKTPHRSAHENKTPCGFVHGRVKLAPGKSKTWVLLCGHARSEADLNKYLLRARKNGYFTAKRQENRRLIESLKSPVFTVSGSGVYDAYCGQTFLDNILRGGTPITFGNEDRSLTYYVYSRKHGDLERDYNRFLVEDSYFSQGDGNYRDVNQNRRNDLWFDPRVGTANIKIFMNLIQLDGFNPLVVKGSELHFKKNEASRKTLTQFLGPKGARSAEEYLAKPFKLGEFYRYLESAKLAQPSRFEKMIRALAPYLHAEQKAEHGEGFWVDHWTYNLDLIESYLAIYPEKSYELLLGEKDYRFFEDSHRVRPRDEKYYLKPGRGVRQYQAVWNDKEKAARIDHRLREKSWVRTRHGKGDIYETNLLVKLLALSVNKLASLDSAGMGMEMEADKPSWYDALNGLPGLAGSSICETFELKRLLIFMIQSIDALTSSGEDTLMVPAELSDFMQKMAQILEKMLRDRNTSQNYWAETTNAKEKYRIATAEGVSGTEKKWSLAGVKSLLEHGREKIDLGLERAYDPKTGLFPTYFENEVVKHQALDHGRVRPLVFKSKALPNFLEGMVHAMKVEKDPARRKAMYQAVKKSPLYDTKLGMYKVNAPMASAGMEIGRARVFTPGWLENESIWLHMEYKYLLEVLRSGMNEEFFDDAKKALIPFQPAERYGRSPLENSSFIVSSVFPDTSIHGTGFVARLSGSTAEFIHLWLLMNVGKRPFVLGPDGKISLRFEPHLAASFFTDKESARVYVDADGQEQAVKVAKNSFAFLFLGRTLVTYHNPRGLDTYGKVRVSVRRLILQDSRGRKYEFKGDTIPAPWAQRVREGIVPRIDIELG